MNQCWREVDEALNNLRTPTIAQTLGDLSLAQFWLQKVGTLATLAHASSDVFVQDFYATLLEKFFNYENAVHIALGTHRKPRYSTSFNGAVMLLENINRRDVNRVFRISAIAGG